MNTDYLKLIRFKVTILVGLSAFAGTCLFSPVISEKHLYGVLAAVLLAAGCSALNQWQERKEDFLMERTRDRPIPSGRMKPEEALMFACIILAVAFTLVVRMKNPQLFILSVAAVIVYNLLYTPMKKRTPFALMTGSVSGAFPPLIGFTAAGGSILDTRIMAVSVVLYIWQTPHFALLSEKYASDYARAGFKTLSGTYGSLKAQKFTDLWTSAYVTSLFFIPMSGVYSHTISSWIHVGLTLAAFVLFLKYRLLPSKAFHALNASMGFFFILLIADKMLTLI